MFSEFLPEVRPSPEKLQVPQNFPNKKDKNTFNKLTKSKKINNANEIKTSNFNSDLSRISNSVPFTVNPGSVNGNFNSNHYENFKSNNKKDPKAFKVIAPILISSIPKFDL
jgi:hypothetical protein